VVDRRLAFGALLAAALLASCHSGETGNAMTPTPQPTAAASTATAPTAAGALDSYLGHYPFDAVGGVRFLDQPAVAKAVAALVPDAKVRALVLGGEGPGTPVARKDGKLLAWGCETHNCGAHDWAILIAPDGGEASVCYHDAATMRERARWYLAPGRSEMRDGDCPSE
jgi:hypothetical protein